MLYYCCVFPPTRPEVLTIPIVVIDVHTVHIVARLISGAAASSATVGHVHDVCVERQRNLPVKKWKRRSATVELTRQLSFHKRARGPISPWLAVCVNGFFPRKS